MPSGRDSLLSVSKPKIILWYSFHEALSLLLVDHGKSLLAYCHGSDLNPRVLEGHGQAGLQLTCSSNKFLTEYGQEVSMESLSCSGRHEPHIIRTVTSCSSTGANGRTPASSDLVLIQIGWLVEGVFHKQIQLCVDELFYATLWSNHQTLGAHLSLSDSTSTGLTFKRDISGYKRLFPGFPSQTALAKLVFHAYSLLYVVMATYMVDPFF